MLSYMSSATGIRKGMEKMQRAFEIYPYCAMALNYLANHFFFTGQHFLVEQLTETALAVSNHGPTKSHSYYNLARSYHSKVRLKKKKKIPSYITLLHSCPYSCVYVYSVTKFFKEIFLLSLRHSLSKSHSTSDVLFPGFQGDYEKAGLYYMASVKEVNKPHEFVFPYYGWYHHSVYNVLCITRIC